MTVSSNKQLQDWQKTWQTEKTLQYRVSFLMRHAFKAVRKKEMRSVGKENRSNRWVWGSNIIHPTDQLKRVAHAIVSELERDPQHKDSPTLSVFTNRLAQDICERGRGLWQRPESIYRFLPGIMREIRPGTIYKRSREQNGRVHIFQWNSGLFKVDHEVREQTPAKLNEEARHKKRRRLRLTYTPAPHFPPDSFPPSGALSGSDRASPILSPSRR